MEILIPRMINQSDLAAMADSPARIQNRILSEWKRSNPRNQVIRIPIGSLIKRARRRNQISVVASGRQERLLAAGFMNDIPLASDSVAFLVLSASGFAGGQGQALMMSAPCRSLARILPRSRSKRHPLPHVGVHGICLFVQSIEDMP